MASLLPKTALPARASRASTPRSSVKVLAAAKSKVAAKAGAYVCLQCGYLYDGATPFADLKAYACPICAAPKRRFKELRGNTSRGNDAKSRVARMDKLKAQIEADGGNPDEGGDELLLATGATIVAALAFLAYINFA